MDKANVFSSQFEYDEADPPGYRGGIARVGQAAGGREITVKLFEVPPEESLCPYHYEYVEEWLLVLDGNPVLRTPVGEQPLEPGDLVCFPAGPEGAHKVSNPGGRTVKMIMFSSSREPSVAVYPDSDKIGVWPGNPDDNLMLRRADGRREYYDREPKPGSRA